MTDEQIIEELRLGSMGEDLKKRSVDNVRATVSIRVGALMTEIMTPEQMTHFEKLQSAGDNDAIWKWLREEITQVDMSEVYEATLKDYIEEVKQQQADF